MIFLAGWIVLCWVITCVIFLYGLKLMYQESAKERQYLLDRIQTGSAQVAKIMNEPPIHRPIDEVTFESALGPLKGKPDGR